MKIKRDEAAGKHHHRRASALLKRLASWAPWLEAAGFLTFVAYYLDVPLLQPWLGWLGWSFAATVVVVIIVGQTWLVRHAARSHNYAREARAAGNRYEAEQESTRRNQYAWLTAVTAVAITSGMIWRGIAALGQHLEPNPHSVVLADYRSVRPGRGGFRLRKTIRNGQTPCEHGARLLQHLAA